MLSVLEPTLGTEYNIAILGPACLSELLSADLVIHRFRYWHELSTRLRIHRLADTHAVQLLGHSHTVAAGVPLLGSTSRASDSWLNLRW